MPAPDFYGFDAQMPARTHAELVDICTRQDIDAWRTWFGRFDQCCPRDLPGDLAVTQCQMHAGLPNLQRDATPAADSPSLVWALREYLCATAPTRHRIRDDGFNGAFDDGLNILTRLASDAQRAAYRQYLDRMLMPAPTLFPSSVEFLRNLDAYCSYMSATELQTILDDDEQSAFMSTVTQSLQVEPDWTAHYATMLHDWKSFLFEVAHAGRDLYYVELAT